MEAGSAIYAAVLKELEDQATSWTPVAITLEGHRKKFRRSSEAAALQLNAMADIGKRGPGNRFSLVDGVKARDLYQAHVTCRTRPPSFRGFASMSCKSGSLLGFQRRQAQLDGQIIAVGFRAGYGRDHGRLTFRAILERFYPTDGARRVLFQTLRTLGSPLFWLDPGWQNQNTRHIGSSGISGPKAGICRGVPRKVLPRFGCGIHLFRFAPRSHSLPIQDGLHGLLEPCHHSL